MGNRYDALGDALTEDAYEADRLAEDLERVSVSAATSAAFTIAVDATPRARHQHEVIVLDTAEACARALGGLIARGDPVAVDFEGIALSRTGKLCLAQVAPRDGPVYLVDVTVMGSSAFTAGRFGELLASKAVLKLIFDCRSDSDALYHQYGVEMRNLYDVQVVYCLKGDQDNAGESYAHNARVREVRITLDSNVS